MSHIGAERGLESHTNQLAIADLDQELLHHWQERALQRGAGFKIGIWEGKYPEKYIGAIVELHDLLNQQPFGDLEIEDFTFSADHIRQSEKSLFARGYERWTLFVREVETEKFAGYTVGSSRKRKRVEDLSAKRSIVQRRGCWSRGKFYENGIACLDWIAK